MSGADLHELSVAEAGRQLRSGAITSRALTEHALARIAALDPVVKAFITITAERAMKDALAADNDFARGVDKGPLQGIPYGLKDIYDTAGILTTCHSWLRMNNIPASDSAVEEKFRAQGAVLLGKLATHEFALGGPSFDLPFPPARNPWNTDHAPGGSSSGSGAAVAAGLMRIAMGTDTGASIRGPAALCGIVGIKPTFGLISRRGVFPLSYSLDHTGPLTFSVEDAAIALEVLAGHDPRDPGSANVAKPAFRGLLNAGAKGLRIGIPRNFFANAAGASLDVLAGIEAAAQALAAAGAIINDVTLPDYDEFSTCGRVIMFCEAFAIHEKDFRERPLDYGFNTWTRMMVGAFATAPDIIQAHRLRRELMHAVNAKLQDFDVLLTACSLNTAPRFDAGGDWTSPSESPVQAMPFNVTGHPAISMPTGLASNGLPMSVQLVGRHFDEPMLLRVASALEKAMGWPGPRPAIAQLPPSARTV